MIFRAYILVMPSKIDDVRDDLTTKSMHGRGAATDISSDGAMLHFNIQANTRTEAGETIFKVIAPYRKFCEGVEVRDITPIHPREIKR